MYPSFETKKAAADYIDNNIDGGTYYLSHGEYSPPIYTPRRYKDGWGVHVEYYYYPGTYAAPEDGRVSYEHMARINGEYWC